MKRRLVPLAMMFVVLWSSCGSSDQATESRQTEATAAPTTALEDARNTAHDERQESSTTAEDTTAASPGARQRLYTPDPKFPISIEYTLPGRDAVTWRWEYRLCVERGQTVTVTVNTVPNAFLTIVATYRDGDPRDSYELAEASPKGRFDWKWVVPPTAPIGDGVLLLNAKRPEGDSRADDRQFRVAGSC